VHSLGGIGNANHLIGVLFADAAGIAIEPIPYRGTGPALLDFVAGRMTMNFFSLPPAIRQAREGRLRVPAGAGATCIAAVPEVPTWRRPVCRAM